MVQLRTQGPTGQKELRNYTSLMSKMHVNAPHSTCLETALQRNRATRPCLGFIVRIFGAARLFCILQMKMCDA